MSVSVERFDVVVVGNGLFGSAAARHLAAAERSVCLIGAPLSPDPNDPDRVYQSHDDEGRLTRLQDRDPTWAALTRRAVDDYRSLEVAAGISFYEPVGALISARVDGDSKNPLAMMDLTNVEYDYFPPGDRSWRQRWPELEFPSTHYVAYEPAPAGYIRPKQLIQAQNKVAALAGARIRTGTVVDVSPLQGVGYTITSSVGEVLEADSVLLAAGAFVNFHSLVNEPVPVKLKTEMVILGRVSSGDAKRLARVPTVKFMNDDSGPTAGLEGIYMIGPLQYPDGHHYVKMGANISLDTWPTKLAEIQDWFERGRSDRGETDAPYLSLLQPALQSLWPGLAFEGFKTKACIVTYTDDGLPLIQAVDNGLYVATGGNGGGAKGSDRWGLLTAEVILNRRLRKGQKLNTSEVVRAASMWDFR